MLDEIPFLIQLMKHGIKVEKKEKAISAHDHTVNKSKNRGVKFVGKVLTSVVTLNPAPLITGAISLLSSPIKNHTRYC